MTLLEEKFSKSFYDQKPGVKYFKWEGHDKKSELVSSGVYFFQISDGRMLKNENDIIKIKFLHFFWSTYTK